MVNVDFNRDTSSVFLGDRKSSGLYSGNGGGWTQEDSLNTIDTPLNIRSNSSTRSAITATGPEIEIENLDGVPFSNRLAFSRIGSLTNPPSNGVHNLVTLRTKNIGNSALRLFGVPIVGPRGNWQTTFHCQQLLPLEVTWICGYASRSLAALYTMAR